MPSCGGLAGESVPRLPKGMFQRPNRSGYYVRVSVGRGKRRWVSLGSDLEEAKRKLRKIRNRGLLTATRMTIGQLAQMWLDEVVKVRRSDKGYKLAKRRVEMYLTPFLGLRPLSMLRGDELHAYRGWIEQKKRSAGTTAYLLGDVRAMLRYAESLELIDRSPFPRRLMPRMQ